MTWLETYAKGHHGYPQPEDGYETALYDSYCLRCGIHGAQASLIRLKNPAAGGHSHFIQPNWLFDVFLVRPEVETAFVREGVTGVSFRDVLVHKSGQPSPDLRQMVIAATVPCIETSRLQRVTCTIDNEEEGWECLGNKRYPPGAPFCNCIKHHPPTKVAFQQAFSEPPTDALHSAEWFGSGGSAHHLTLVSERFKAIVERYNFRGLGFSPVMTTGYSERNET